MKINSIKCFQYLPTVNCWKRPWTLSREQASKFGSSIWHVFNQSSIKRKEKTFSVSWNKIMLKLWLRHTIFHKIEGKQTNEFNISRIKSFPLYSSMKKKHIAATFWQFGAFASLVSLKKKLFTITQTSQNYSCLKMSKYILVIVFFLLGLKCFTDWVSQKKVVAIVFFLFLSFN